MISLDGDDFITTIIKKKITIYIIVNIILLYKKKKTIYIIVNIILLYMAKYLIVLSIRLFNFDPLE